MRVQWPTIVRHYFRFEYVAGARSSSENDCHSVNELKIIPKFIVKWFIIDSIELTATVLNLSIWPNDQRIIDDFIYWYGLHKAKTH